MKNQTGAATQSSVVSGEIFVVRQGGTDFKKGASILNLLDTIYVCMCITLNFTSKPL